MAKSSKSEKICCFFCAYLWHFPFLPVLENKRGKVLKINVHFLFSGFVGSERKSIFYKRVDNPL